MEVLQDAACIELMRRFISENPGLWNEDIGASVEIAVGFAGDETLEELFKKADAALNAAKRDGKHTFREADVSIV